MIAPILFGLLLAQSHASAPRSDGHQTPLAVYAAKGATGCPPLALISHGAGGNENGYKYLAQGLADQGYTAIVMGHRESGLEAMGSDMLSSGFGPGLRKLVTDRSAEEARLLDIAAALKYASAQCQPSFRVLLGHSMGAITVMMEAGARNIVNVGSPPAAQDRFDAYVALSPEGSGLVFSDNAWSAIRKPMLIMSGTRDPALNGPPEVRQMAFASLSGIPSHCQWIGVIDGATHMNLAGAGFGADRVQPMVTATIASFLKGVRGGQCPAPPPARGMTLRTK